MSERPTVCRHGCLRRSCEPCDLAEDVERLERERDALREALQKAIAEADEWYNECRGGACPRLGKERALLGKGAG